VKYSNLSKRTAKPALATIAMSSPALAFLGLAFLGLACLSLAWPGSAQAQGPSQTTSYSRASVSGTFLAARQAGNERDVGAAATYYRAALRLDPRNNELLEKAFLAVLQNGDVEEAVRLAERVLQADKNHKVAHLVLGVRAIKQKQYPKARQEITQSVRGQITDLAATLLSSWTQASANENKAAIEALDKLNGPEWYNLFKNLHAGLILELVGQRKEATKRYERAYQLDQNALRIVQAHANNLVRQGSKDEGLKIYKAFDEQLPRHPLITEAINDTNAGKRVPSLVDSIQAGAAESLYGLGAALGRRSEDLAVIYLQLALYLAPSHSMALLSLADIYEGTKKFEYSNKIYERVPATSPMHRNAQIQRALGLDSLERSEEALAVLAKLVAENPGDLEAVTALGNVQRGRKLYAECAQNYSKGIDTIKKEEKPNWVIFYFRGICNERAKQWPKAEADFKKALELSPEQPLVLNYLGYSWVDQGIHLDDGMNMIRRAVEQRADDGYIVDSLGWAYYRIGNFDEAVKHLERAVEIKPEDPTINDHLGDAYWKVGRTLEAQFQWSHARDLKPEPEDLPKILEKLKSGLTDEPAAASVDERNKKPGGG
jgi:tetratricopeptide (TPR) repeat protein